ncbi:MAG: hypothetical protein C4582_10350 [Desulfobacteraceae bacterium]|jgi:hypothetical protein|nr:MAG: hypothetical protein C4582_10350 [Desulfobacteraceae bacterium]
MAFSQSEKLKAGIIWISGAVEVMAGIGAAEKKGAERVIRLMLGMVSQEVRLAATVAPSGQWQEVDRFLDQAMVMFDSGVGADSVYHLTQALSRVTGIGHASMNFLKEKGLI